MSKLTSAVAIAATVLAAAAFAPAALAKGGNPPAPLPGGGDLGGAVGDRVSLSFAQGGKPGLHPNVGLSGTLSPDGRTIAGIFDLTPVTLSR